MFGVANPKYRKIPFPFLFCSLSHFYFPSRHVFITRVNLCGHVTDQNRKGISSFLTRARSIGLLHDMPRVCFFGYPSVLFYYPEIKATELKLYSSKTFLMIVKQTGGMKRNTLSPS